MEFGFNNTRRNFLFLFIGNQGDCWRLIFCLKFCMEKSDALHFDMDFYFSYP